MPNYAADKRAAAEWARDVLEKAPRFIILDTETTGLGSDARVCQIAIIDLSGNVLLDTLVNPECEIPQEATNIHGITSDMVADAPKLTDVLFSYDLELKTRDRSFIVYNFEYDNRVISQHLKQVKSNFEFGLGSAWEDCAMKQYAKFIGDWNDYHRSYKWQRLPAIPDYPPHQALSDCFATLALIKQMAAFLEDAPQDIEELPF